LIRTRSDPIRIKKLNSYPTHLFSNHVGSDQIELTHRIGSIIETPDLTVVANCQVLNCRLPSFTFYLVFHLLTIILCSFYSFIIVFFYLFFGSESPRQISRENSLISFSFLVKKCSGSVFFQMKKKILTYIHIF
jgi:hypothetical protein